MPRDGLPLAVERRRQDSRHHFSMQPPRIRIVIRTHFLALVSELHYSIIKFHDAIHNRRFHFIAKRRD